MHCLALWMKNLTKKYSDIKIGYGFAPPFRPLTRLEDSEICEAINLANIDVLFVGIGCPKQEIWMASHRDKLNCVMLGVGAAFDFVAGHKTAAPPWVQKLGLEWLFRLACEPQRLWRRYLKQNPRFIYYFTKQLIHHKICAKGGQ